MPDFDAYAAKLDAILASVDRLSDAQLRAALAALNDARGAIIDRLVAAAAGGNTYSATVLATLIADVQRIGAEYERRLGQSMEGALRRAWDIGASTLPDAWTAAGIGETFRIGLDTRLLDIASQLTADLVREVSQNFITLVSREIRLGALGALSVQETMRRVRALLATQPDRLNGRFGPILSQAERIVRTEIMRCYNLSNEARMRQAAEMVPGLRKYWLATPDARTRDTHLQAWLRYRPGGSVGPIPVKDDFIVGGFPAAYPYDPRLPARESVNCFVGSTVVMAPGPQRGFSRAYEGEVVRIRTASGKELTGTPNHPIATTKGWIPLGSLDKSSYVFCARNERRMAASYPDVFHGPAAFAEILDSLRMMGMGERIVGAGMDFHGDGAASDIDVVTPFRELGDAGMAPFFEQRGDLWLPRPDVLQGSLSGYSSASKNVLWNDTPTPSSMGGRSKFDSLLFAKSSHANQASLAHAAWSYSGVKQAGSDGGAGDGKTACEREFGLPSDVTLYKRLNWHIDGHGTKDNAEGFEVAAQGLVAGAVRLRESVDSFPALVTLDNVVSVERYMFSGQVYNLETSTSWYLANGIVAHNCRCRSVSWHPDWFSKEEAA